MFRLLKYLKQYRVQTIIAPLFKFLEAVFDLLVPLVVAKIIDDGIYRQNNSTYIISMFVLLLGLAAIGLVCSVTAQYFAARAATGFASNIRAALFDKLNRLSYSQIDDIGIDTMIARMTGDVVQIQDGLNLFLRLLLRSPFIIVGALVAAMLLDFKTSLILCVVVPLVTIVLIIIVKISIKLFKKVQYKNDSVLNKVRESITGIRVIRAFNADRSEYKDFEKENKAQTRSQFKAGNVSVLLNPMTYAIVNMGIILLIYIGAIRVSSGDLTQGQVIALYNYMSQILIEIVKFANVFINVSKGMACADRVAEVFDIPEDEKTPTGKISDDYIRFEDVSLVYPKNNVASVSDISFSAPKGSVIGLIGGTGAGKTTIINLIGGFYRPTEGTIFFDGKDMNDICDDELRNRIAVVPQKAQLFKGTIRSNLEWGRKDLSDEDINEAIETAQAVDIIEAKEKGLDEPVEQNGRNFSGGQKQRLTIARALVKKPDLLLLDDSSSALDFATDLRLRTALAKIKDITVVISAQRTASVMNADIILVLENGKVVGKGKHEDLLKGCKVYKEIYDSQFAEVSR